MDQYNLFEFKKLLENVSLKHPFVNTVLFNRYKINTSDCVKYPVVTYLFNSVQVGEDITTYNLSIIYADRLTSCRDNSTEIQSLGITVISELVNFLYNKLLGTTNTMTFNLFKDQYADECAGVIANNVQFALPSEIGSCEYLCIDDIDLCDC
jgi:hypothetical protein